MLIQQRRPFCGTINDISQVAVAKRNKSVCYIIVRVMCYCSVKFLCYLKCVIKLKIIAALHITNPIEANIYSLMKALSQKQPLRGESTQGMIGGT